MPNKNAVCECGVVLDLPKSRNGMMVISTGNLAALIPKKSKKNEGRSSKKQSEGARGPHSRASDSESTSSVTEQAPSTKNKQEKRLNSTRRTRSAERAESHYTYIDSGSSIVRGGVRENSIPEALYCTIDDDDDPPTGSANGNAGSQGNTQNRPQPVYSIPSMTSPPPTYDVAIAKSLKSSFPPSYEEYLYHNYTVFPRSHTPPPPWSDYGSTNSVSLQHARRELLASQPELREYLAQLSLADQGSHHYQVLRDAGNLSNPQALRKQQAVRMQRTRPMPLRSQSESRAQQQRLATMYDDGAFCMETTALQCAVENGIAFCSLM